MFSPTSPVTGLAQTGFTSPTYTLTADSAPENNAKKWSVTALGGTQTGVVVASVALPFSHTFWKPRILKVLQAVSGQLNVIGKRETNVYNLVTVKGVLPLAGQPGQNMVIDTKLTIPAGADTADAANIRAALSSHFGLLSQQSAGIGDTAINGIV